MLKLKTQSRRTKEKKQGRHQRPPARGQFVWTLLSGHFIFRLLGSPKGSAESGLKEKQYPGQLIFDYAPTNPAAAVRITTTTTTAGAGAWSEAITNLQSPECWPTKIVNANEPKNIIALSGFCQSSVY